MGGEKQPLIDDNRWSIEIDTARFNKLKSEERFWQLVALSRAVNSLRFVQAPILAHPDESNSAHATRTRFNSFFFTCSLLYEALLLVERMGRYFHQVSEFALLHAILKDRTATELRTSNLNPLRNRLTFHFSEDEIGAQLLKSDVSPRFVSGDSRKQLDIYYELADMCTVGAFSGLQLNQQGAIKQFGEQANSVTELAIRLVGAAETFIGAVLMADGWELVEKGLHS